MSAQVEEWFGEVRAQNRVGLTSRLLRVVDHNMKF